MVTNKTGWKFYADRKLNLANQEHGHRERSSARSHNIFFVFGTKLQIQERLQVLLLPDLLVTWKYFLVLSSLLRLLFCAEEKVFWIHTNYLADAVCWTRAHVYNRIWYETCLSLSLNDSLSLVMPVLGGNQPTYIFIKLNLFTFTCDRMIWVAFDFLFRGFEDCCSPLFWKWMLDFYCWMYYFHQTYITSVQKSTYLNADDRTPEKF